jgi:hypothetical protein
MAINLICRARIRRASLYKEYFLLANRFILLIHDLTKADLKKLDDLTHRYLKSWLGMPQSASTFWAQSPLHAQPGDLDLPLHPHPIVESGPQPPQVEPIPTQTDSVPNMSAIRKEVWRLFCEEDDAWDARVRGYTI